MPWLKPQPTYCILHAAAATCCWQYKAMTKRREEKVLLIFYFVMNWIFLIKKLHTNMMVNVSVNILNLKMPPFLYPWTTIQSSALERKVKLSIILLFYIVLFVVSWEPHVVSIFPWADTKQWAGKFLTGLFSFKYFYSFHNICSYCKFCPFSFLSGL